MKLKFLIFLILFLTLIFTGVFFGFLSFGRKITPIQSINSLVNITPTPVYKSFKDLRKLPSSKAEKNLESLESSEIQEGQKINQNKSVVQNFTLPEIFSTFKKTPQKNNDYNLIGAGCTQNVLPNSCELLQDKTMVATLKNCQLEIEAGCNLYSYSLQKENDKELFIFQEYLDNEIKLLDVLKYNFSTQKIELVESFIYDISIPQSVIDYNNAKSKYQK